MQDPPQKNVENVSAPVPPAASPAGAASSSVDARTRATPAPHGGGPAPTAQQTEGTRRIHPLWIVAGAAALFGLVFGVGAVAQGAGNALSPSGTSIEQTSINAIQTA